MAAERRVGRRAFLRYLATGGLITFAVEAVVAFVTFIYPRRFPIFGNRLTLGTLANLPEDSPPERVLAGKLYFTRFPDGLLALYWRCRHQGCAVIWNASETFVTESGERLTGVFHCPCHNSIYRRDGQVVAGPAPGPLDVFTVEVEPDGTIVVDTGEIWRRPVAGRPNLTPARPGAIGPADRAGLTRTGIDP